MNEKMWVLLDKDENVIPLKGQNVFTVGRINTDLILSDDKSISRNHAIIKIKQDKSSEIPQCFIKDNDSTYGTSVVCQNSGTIKKITNEYYNVSNNEIIKFGMLNHDYKFVYTGLYKYWVLTSTLIEPEKERLTKILEDIEGRLCLNMHNLVTHLTCTTVKLTHKTVYSLANAIPIVNVKFWEDTLNSIKKKKQLLPVPTTKLYRPPLDNRVLEELSGGYLDLNLNRKTIFSGMKFIFFDDIQMLCFDKVIRTAGGTSIFYTDNSTIDVNDLSPDIIYLAPSDDNAKVHTFQLINKKLNSTGRRAIPESDIALAVLHCSREKFCNPFYSYEKNLIKKPSNNKILTATVIAKDTQSQSQRRVNRKNPKIIPESIYPDSNPNIIPETVDLESNLNIVPETVEPESNEFVTPASVKSTPVNIPVHSSGFLSTRAEFMRSTPKEADSSSSGFIPESQFSCIKSQETTQSRLTRKRGTSASSSVKSTPVTGTVHSGGSREIISSTPLEVGSGASRFIPESQFSYIESQEATQSRPIQKKKAFVDVDVDVDDDDDIQVLSSTQSELSKEKKQLVSDDEEILSFKEISKSGKNSDDCDSRDGKSSKKRNVECIIESSDEEKNENVPSKRTKTSDAVTKKSQKINYPAVINKQRSSKPKFSLSDDYEELPKARENKKQVDFNKPTTSKQKSSTKDDISTVADTSTSRNDKTGVLAEKTPQNVSRYGTKKFVKQSIIHVPVRIKIADMSVYIRA